MLPDHPWSPRPPAEPGDADLQQPPNPLGAPPPAVRKPRDRYWLHLLLFVLTLLTTLMVGAELVTNRTWLDLGQPNPLQIADLGYGVPYALAFLAFLTSHEFGHYFMAAYHRVRASLPYFLPVWLPLLGLQIGTFGAVIRIRQVPETTRKYFDIGIAGPLAGFIVAVALLWVGFATLPPAEYVFRMHPEYEQDFGRVPTEAETLQRYGMLDTDEGPQPVQIPALGNSLLFYCFEQFVADPDRLPNHLEMMHYPLLYAGYLALFFTALNLLPIGQLDGGHVVYGLFGRRRAALIARVTVVLLMLYGGLGLVVIGEEYWTIRLLVYLLYLTWLLPRILGTRSVPLVLGGAFAVLAVQQGLQWLYPGAFGGGVHYLWLFYAFMAVRVIGLDHPPALVEMPLDAKRRVLGWVAIAIFVLCITPMPFELRSALNVMYDAPGSTRGIMTLLGR